MAFLVNLSATGEHRLVGEIFLGYQKDMTIKFFYFVVSQRFRCQ